MRKGFTLLCNECGNQVNYVGRENKRHNIEEKISITIHSNTECGIICFECENKAVLNDKE
ncbi:hypothetical protein ACQUY5_30705 [Bacillus cereus]|uniref:hypothetical protein n=1 Tax=Bacillus cereus TaxID=1396 RepID=UPI003D17CBB5